MLKPSTGGLSNDQLKVYEDFNRLQNADAQSDTSITSADQAFFENQMDSMVGNVALASQSSTLSQQATN